jgi:hypothetical protein
MIVAVVWVLLKIRLSYNSFGGTVMVTVYDAAIFPPFIGVFGLYWVAGSFGIDYSVWLYVGLEVVLAILVAIVIRVAENLGDRRREWD